VDASCAPILLIHGEADDVVSVEQSDAMDRALTENGVRHAYNRMPGEGHSFTFPAWNQIECLYLEFLRAEFSVGVGAPSTSG
jgi:dipeptidyl aminopeptidase/acylaminoacyl peptidase